MKELHKKEIGNTKKSISEDGQSYFLCSYNELPDCPPSDINSNELSEELAIEYLTTILLHCFIDYMKNEKNRKNP
jgi:hypothetical protein